MEYKRNDWTYPGWPDNKYGGPKLVRALYPIHAVRSIDSNYVHPYRPDIAEMRKWIEGVQKVSGAGGKSGSEIHKRN